MYIQFHDCAIMGCNLFAYKYIFPIKPIFSCIGSFCILGCYFVKFFPFLHLAQTEIRLQLWDIFEERIPKKWWFSKHIEVGTKY